eukprot:symbB.v1.2.016489.t1/scaffold1254.1/size128712/3
MITTWFLSRLAEATCKQEKFIATLGHLDIDDQVKRAAVEKKCNALLMQVNDDEAKQLKEAFQKIGFEAPFLLWWGYHRNHWALTLESLSHHYQHGKY